MHKVLRISELLHAIFLFVDEAEEGTTIDRSLPRFARICKTFHGPALDLLWRRLNGIGPLMDLIPRRLKDDREVLDEVCSVLRM